MKFIKRALLGSFVAVGGMAATVFQLKCKAQPFKLYDRLICPECLTATVDNGIEYGTNIDHYQPFRTIDWEGMLPEMKSIVIYGEDELAFALIACLRRFGFHGEITYKATTLPYRKRELIKRLKDSPEDLLIRPRGFYNNYKVRLEDVPKPQVEDPRFPTPVFRRTTTILADFNVFDFVTPLPQGVDAESNRVHKLDNIKDFEKLQKGLKTAKSIHIVGGTPESLELFYQIKQDFPQLALSYSYEQLPEEIAGYAPKDSLAGYSFSGLGKDAVCLSKANEIKNVNGDLVIFSHQKSEPGVTTPLNAQTTTYKLGNVLKLFPNNQHYLTNNLENVHNIIMNAMGKRASFYYLPVEAYKFGREKPVFLMGEFEAFDSKYEQNGIAYYFKNGLLIGAKGQDPRAISVLREAVAVDCVPVYQDTSALHTHNILLEVQQNLNKTGVQSRLKTQLQQQKVQHR